MTTKKQTRQHIDLPRLLTVQIVGFVMFHLNQEILFSVVFERAILKHQWVGNWVSTFGSWIWLYGPGVAILWLAYRAKENWSFAVGFAGLTFYCAYHYQYPVLTSFLFQLGQFKQFSLWMMDHVPTIAAIYGI